MAYDVIIIGSGAGGAALAHRLTLGGRRVLLLEKGPDLPRDGSTLDTEAVLRQGRFLSREPWLDRRGCRFAPEEHFNLGGKTRWYGAALLRYAPHEFGPDLEHRCLAWPIGYEDLAPYYREAESLLDLRRFAVEPGLGAIAAGLRSADPAWRQTPMPLGLVADILARPQEAVHFDAYASISDAKADAQSRLLAPLRRHRGLTLRCDSVVTALLPAADPQRIAGVVCADGARHEAATVVLAAGALHSPRLLQAYLEASGLAHELPNAKWVGRYYKSHLLTAMLALSLQSVPDVLSKTLLLEHPDFPHSTVQTLGGQLAAEILRTRLPRLLPPMLVTALTERVVGLFLQTEDGSHVDNRVIAAAAPDGLPRLDYDPARTPAALLEHVRLVRRLRLQLLHLGYVAVSRRVPLAGTAHACGTLLAGRGAASSVVDADGRVHGLDNLYVADGSVLPRSGRANPALSIYAWGLRLGSHLLAQAGAERSR